MATCSTSFSASNLVHDLSASDTSTRASSWIASSAFKKSHTSRQVNKISSVKLVLSTKKSHRSFSVVSQASSHAVVDSPLAQPRVQNDDSLFNELQSCGDRLSQILGNANIYLIGMMGCGKTTVGKILSDSLGYYFFDSDTVVEQTVGTSVAEIFAKQGEQAFRDRETQAIQNLSAMDGLIVATGGGAIIRPENWKLMKNGVVVWLDVPLTDLATRVVKAGVGSRPLVDSENDNEQDQYSAALDKLSSIYERRKHLYPNADLRLSLNDISTKYEVGSVAAVTPSMIALELINGVTSVLEERHLSDAYCPLDPSWTDEEILLPLPVNHETMANAV